MRSRALQITFMIDGKPVLLTEELNIKVNIKKNCFVMQNRAVIDIFNLSKTVRETLLSRFSAWKRRKNDESPESTDEAPIDVEIKAGYNAPTTPSLSREVSSLSTVFRGQVALVEPLSGPPEIATRITCFTRQVDRSTFKSRPAPTKCTLREYVQWIAKEMKLTEDPVIDTVKADDVLKNPAAGNIVLSALVTYLQSIYGVDVYAYVDDGRLIVKDAWKIANKDQTVMLTEFVNIPLWNEYGVTFTTLFDPAVLLASAVNLKSEMNNAVDGDYVVYILEYQLNSRDTAFYVTGFGSPPAQ